MGKPYLVPNSHKSGESSTGPLDCCLWQNRPIKAYFEQNSFILPKFTIDACFLYFYYSTYLAKPSQFTIFAVRLEAEGFLEVRVG